MNRRQLLFSASAMFCTLASAQTVPLQISPYPLVYAAVNVNGAPCLALLDTGSATPLRISSTLARQLQLTLTPDPRASAQGLDGKRHPVQRGKLASLQLGELTLQQEEVEVTADRIEGVAAQVGTAFDVVLGWGLLSRQSFALDYRQRQLQLDGLRSAAASAIMVPYSVINRLPVVRGVLEGRDALLLVDTGAPMCNIDLPLAGAAPGAILAKTLKLGSLQRSVDWRVKDLSAPRQALGTSGTLGNNLLGQYRVLFDIRTQTLVLD